MARDTPKLKRFHDDIMKELFTVQKGDVIFDLSHGLAMPTIAVVEDVSCSWFRKKNPYKLVRTHERGIYAPMQAWMSKKIIIETLKHPKVKVMRNNVQVWPKVKNA
jgi:hypothetical protein